jgi:hypothetical protein
MSLLACVQNHLATSTHRFLSLDLYHLSLSGIILSTPYGIELYLMTVPESNFSSPNSSMTCFCEVGLIQLFRNSCSPSHFQNQQQYSFSNTAMPGAQSTSTTTHSQQSLLNSATHSNSYDSQFSSFAGPASMSGAVAPGPNPFPCSTIPTGNANFSANSSDPNQPKNATKFQIMSELMQMGFTDQQEMNNGTRQLKKPQPMRSCYSLSRNAKKPMKQEKKMKFNC